jgi:hypothetical protein
MRKRSITIVIFLDGLGWGLAGEHGFLRDDLPLRGPLATMFGGSSSSLFTILTGSAPREHGQFAPYIYDPTNSPFREWGWMRFMPHFLAAHRQIRRWLSRWLRSRLRLGADLDLYNVPLELLPQMSYTGSPTCPDKAHEGGATLFDDLRDAGVPFRVFAGKSDQESLEMARRGIAEGDLEFVYLALSGLDEFLHAHGTRSGGVPRKLAAYEAQVRELMHTAREHYDEVKLALFSANGMADITSECNLMRQVEALPLRLGEDYFVIYDSTMARFWFLNGHAERTIGEALSGNLDGQWLSDHTLRQWGCDFPGRRYGHRIFLLRPGVLMNPSFMTRGSRAAMHGYDPWHKDSVAFFATNDAQMGRPAGLANLRDLLSASVGVFRLATRSA